MVHKQNLRCVKMILFLVKLQPFLFPFPFSCYLYNRSLCESQPGLTQLMNTRDDTIKTCNNNTVMTDFGVFGIH